MRVGVVIGWLAFVAATQHWRSWDDSVRLDYATDVAAFEAIARAAPGFPATAIQTPHADRFVVHWTVGELANLSQLPLHAVYAIVSGVVLAGLLGSLHATLRALHASPTTYAISIGMVVASAYPFRYQLAAPGMVADALFLLGLALVVHAFVARRYRWLLLGVVLAVLGRQTGVPVAIVAGLLLLREPWPARRRPAYAVVAPLLAIVLYAAAHRASAPFADTSGRGIVEMSLLGGSWTGRDLAVHLGRTLVAVAVPVAVVVGASLRARRWPPLAPSLFGAVVFLQAVALAPDWTHAEPRLAGLAAPALAVTAAVCLQAAGPTRSATAVVCGGIAVASLHHIYSFAGEVGVAGWGALTAVGAATVLLTLTIPLQPPLRLTPVGGTIRSAGDRA